MRNPLSEEYALLQRTRQDFPTFMVRTRKIKSNPMKDTYKGLTYEYMKMYIKKYEPKETKEEMLKYLDDQILISKCHGQRLRYPTIKKWFLAKYPEVAKFGIDETEDQDNKQDEAQTAETKNQNAVPASEVPYINDVQTPAVNMLQ
jgi:excinuclease UvrABC ATPase subunit